MQYAWPTGGEEGKSLAWILTTSCIQPNVTQRIRKLESNNVLGIIFLISNIKKTPLLELERNKYFTGKNTSDKKAIHGNVTLIQQ